MKATQSTCVACGGLLNAQEICLACLVRAGLDEAIAIDASIDSLGFGDFEIARRADGMLWELGRGAMGVTYRARDQVLHRDVALKVIDLPADRRRAGTARERFLREARAAAALRHPNVADVFQFGTSLGEDRCYYAMELVEGETLEAFVRREGPFAVPAALELAIQVARALAGAAAQGLIHRDLKPANIMLAANPSGAPEMEVKVIDFGLAKSITAGAGERDLSRGGFVGTPTFASPEQLGGAPVDARSDIYSLGATLWYGLTGEIPFPGKTIEEIRTCQRTLPLLVNKLVTRKVPPPLIQLIRQSLALDAAERPQSARALLAALEACRSASASAPARRGWRRMAMPVILLLLLAAAGATYSWRRAALRQPPAQEKSIAVLPFDNLSPDESNRFFADGIQDDVLTSLAQIHQFKVISRTSVLAYPKDAPRNIREIGRALDVENILEGSVRREGNRVLLNVQLIDARHDRHIWAHRYDRTAQDAIGLQGELATEIATALEAKLTPEVKASLAQKPTENPEAYAFYLQGLGQERAVNHSQADSLAAEKFYAEAIALDPKFALAYARLSIVESSLAWRSAALPRRAEARRTAEEALRLAPQLGEAHMALGLCLYWAEENYPAALRQFSIAEATLPNEPAILHYIAGIDRRLGRWPESLAAYARARRVDPRNREIMNFSAIDYVLVRDWPEAEALYHRALEIAPNSVQARIGLAFLQIYQNDNPGAAEAILHAVPAKLDPDGDVTAARWNLAMLQRDFSAAEKMVDASPGKDFPSPDNFPKEFYLAQVARARGDLGRAERLLAPLEPEVTSWKRENPGDLANDTYLATYYAYRGRKEEAVRAALRAVAAEPESQNAFHGACRLADLAVVYALTGERDKAIALIERLLITSGPVNFTSSDSITLADLRRRWEWDSLRSDPRFQKILAGPEPKTNLARSAPAIPAQP